MEETNITKEEPKKQKKGVSGILVFFLILLFTAAGLVGGWYVGDQHLIKVGTEKEEKEEEKEETKEVSDDAKQKIDSFIKIASHYNYSMSVLPELFYDGVTAEKITSRNKASMTYAVLIDFDKNYESTTEKPQTVLDKVPDSAGEDVKTVSINDYDEIYKKLFNEEPQYEAKGCPYPAIADKETGKIYLFSRCGGIGPEMVNKVENKTYSFDGKYYYVNTDVSYYEKGASEETKKVVWKFDKDLKFVSTTVE